jgi:cytochrome c oxidase assembly protein subunit 15
MTSFLRSDRSQAVALWLFTVAILVMAMVVVGGATRLTGSGLSITEWRPISGALPPMSQHDWQVEFSRYRQIPQFALVNPTMTLDAFKSIYRWEWTHRLLARLVVAAFIVPFGVFLIRRMVPRRLILPCAGMFVLLALQAAVGWWMVASGLVHLTYVAPERLALHLILALLLFILLIWSGLEAWSGKARQANPTRWRIWSLVFLGGILLQCLLGGLVAGNHAGQVYNDWPLMNGDLWPADYAGKSLWATIAHNAASVQMHHRLGAYLLFAAGLALAWRGWQARYLAPEARGLALAVGAGVTLQALLGVATLMAVAPLWLAMPHQIGALVVLALATGFAWRVRRP